MKSEFKHYIGYMTGDNQTLGPDFFEAPRFEHNVGKAWGSYVRVAGPFDSRQDAITAHKNPQ